MRFSLDDRNPAKRVQFSLAPRGAHASDMGRESWPPSCNAGSAKDVGRGVLKEQLPTLGPELLRVLQLLDAKAKECEVC